MSRWWSWLGGARQGCRHSPPARSTCRAHVHARTHKLTPASPPPNPTTDAPSEPDKPQRKLNFRRLLLNKCQEEFEKGETAMAAVAEREKKTAEAGGAGAEEDDKV